MPPKPSDVVVTGIGVLAAAGIGIDAFWHSLLHGTSGIVSLEHRDEGPTAPANWRSSAKAGSWLGGPILKFDAAQFVRPRKALKVMGRELQTAYAASTMAIEMSGLRPAIESRQIEPDMVAMIFGSQMLYGPASELLDAVKHSMDENHVVTLDRFGETAMRNIMPLWMLKYLPNMAACHVGISVGATGPNNTIVSGDVSATSAMIESFGVLHRGIASASVCGATGSRIDETYLVYRGDWPTPTVGVDVAHSSRVHSKNADGVVGAEAASSVVVETRAVAAARGAKELAVVAGCASRFVPPPMASENGEPSRGSAEAIRLAIQAAITSSGLSSGDIGLVISHGMGDPLRDAAERDALAMTLPEVPICAVAAINGHSGAALGGVSMVAAVLALMHKTIPAMPGYAGDHESIGARCSTTPRPLTKPAVIVLTHTSHGAANAIVFAQPTP